MGDDVVSRPDVVADVLVPINEGDGALDVRNNLVERGHTSMTITTVVGYLQRNRPPFRGWGPWAPAEHDD
jgi:hypothetical protein